MSLETERLILDTWQTSDWTAFRPIATDVEVMRYITGGVPWSDEEIRQFVERQMELYRTRGYCRWKLLEKPGKNLIGFCGVGFFHGGLEPELGWWLARACWGRGLATEAATVALRDAFERVRMDRVVSIAMRGNSASTRIMEKLGLEFDCEFENGGVRLVRYAIDRTQYEAKVSAGDPPRTS
jgi:RimJ/RimL family protein N-acetyltransferase